MKNIYSRNQFVGYTHRFIVKLKIDDDYRNDVNVNIYSNCDDLQKLDDFINEKKSNKVVSFDIIHRCTKEQDDLDTLLIEETLKDI
jgi:hypothetical protein